MFFFWNNNNKNLRQTNEQINFESLKHSCLHHHHICCFCKTFVFNANLNYEKTLFNFYITTMISFHIDKHKFGVFELMFQKQLKSHVRHTYKKYLKTFIIEMFTYNLFICLLCWMFLFFVSSYSRCLMYYSTP